MAKAPTSPQGDKPGPRKRAPARPADLAHGRWLGDFPDLSAAEKRLIACSARGEPWEPEGWDGKRPEAESEASTLRAGLVRFLLLGGDARHPVHERGVQIEGAWIGDQLDLVDLRSTLGLMMAYCHFAEAIMAQNARLAGLCLNHSAFPALNAQGIDVQGDVFLKGGQAQGEVCLAGAAIGGQLSCVGAALRHTDKDGKATGHALNAQGAQVKDGVFLDRVQAQGEVSLAGAAIGGQLSCVGAEFAHTDKEGNATGHALNAQGAQVKGGVFLRGMTAQGEVSLAGAAIGGQLSCVGAALRHTDKEGNATGRALNAQGAQVKDGLFFQPKTVVGRVDFTNATIAAIKDDIAAWPKGAYVLTGLTYQRLYGDLDAGRRIGWLRGQVASKLADDFAPQPWEQLIKVLREEGHGGAAAQVAIAKQDAMRAAGQIGQRQVHNFPDAWFPRFRAVLDRAWNPVSNRLARGWHWLYGGLSGYGYRPQRIVYLTALLIALSSLAFSAGRNDGLIGPSDPLIHHSHLAKQCGTGGDPGMPYWTDAENCAVPPEYSTFQPFFYAMDVTLPLVDLHQENEWGPIVSDKDGDTLWGGRILRWLMWFDIAFGWVASLMFVAIVSRLVEKD